MELTESQMLKYAMDNGIIDINTLQMQIEMNERRKYLEKHNHRIWQGADKLWYTKLDDDTKKNGRRLVKRKTEEEVQNEVVEYYKEKENEPTLKDVFYDWVNQKLRYQEIQKQTYDRYEIDFKKFFEENGYSARKIRYLTEIDLEEFVKSTICDNGLTAKSWSNVRTLLYGIFKYAKKRGFTTISITSFMGDLDLSNKIFAKKQKPDEEQVFREDETDMLIKHLLSNPTRGNLGVLVAVYTGMRVGEVVALKWEDIQEDYIYVRRTQVRYKDEDGKEVYDIRDFPKTEAGVRKVVMVDGVKKVFQKLRRMNPFTEYIFERNGKVFTKTALDNCINRACERIGIPRRSMHSLRRTYATRLINANIDDAIITNQMGHTDIETTRRHYYYNDKSFDTMRDLIGKAINY